MLKDGKPICDGVRRACMDTLLRGAIERKIDDTLQNEEILSNALLMFKSLSPTKDIEDALFGYVIGRTIQSAFDMIIMNYQRHPDQSEYDEIAGILERRAMEIRSRIRLIANR